MATNAARFLNREAELARLERWWARGGRAAVVWGRRRVGKTWLLQQFARDKPTIFHTGAGRLAVDELRLLSAAAANLPSVSSRDVRSRPYTDWDDALDDLELRAQDGPVLVVLDEFPELASATPSLPGILRAFLDRAPSSAPTAGIRLLLCGSAVRHMEALQERRQPLYGRFEESLLVAPFTPREAGRMLAPLRPADRALVYGIVGGVPLYLSWWDPRRSVAKNLEELVGEVGGRLLTEGDLVLRTDVEGGDHAGQVLRAIANGRTQFNEVRDHIGTDPSRVIERLIELRLIERLLPVTETAKSRRRVYRILDPFLRFHLAVADRFRTDINRGMGRSILPVLIESLDDHMGDVWEEAFRVNLREAANDGTLPVDDAVAIGSWWASNATDEIDAVVLSGRSRTPTLVGEAKWSATMSAPRALAGLRRKAEQGLKIDGDSLAFALCAREEVTHLDDVGPRPERGSGSILVRTAADLFGG